MGTAIQTIIDGIGTNNTPISAVFDYWDDKVLSVSIKGGEQPPQVGDVVLNMSRVAVSAINFEDKKDNDGNPYEYEKDNICVHDGMLFRLKVNKIAVPGVWNPTEWEELDLVDILCRDFRPNFAYEKWQIVSNDGVIYRAKNDFVSNGEFNPNDWEELSQLQVLEFTPGRYYHKDSQIYRIDPKSNKRILYLAKNNFKAGNTFNLDDWEEVRSSDQTLMLKDFRIETSTADDSTSLIWTYRNPVTDETSEKKWKIVTGDTLTQIFDQDKRTTTIKIDNFAWNEDNEIASPGVVTPADPNKTNPYYRGVGTTANMNAVINPIEGDLFDNTETNTVWTYKGNGAGGASYTQKNTTTSLKWVDTLKSISPLYKETKNYNKVITLGTSTNENNEGIVNSPDTYLKYENRQIKYFGENQINNHKNPDIINLKDLWEDTNLEYLSNVKHDSFNNGEILINGGSLENPNWIDFKTYYKTSGKYPNKTFQEWKSAIENDVTDLQNRILSIEKAIYNWNNDKNTKIPRANINIYSGEIGNVGVISKDPGDNLNDLRFK